MKKVYILPLLVLFAGCSSTEPKNHSLAIIQLIYRDEASIDEKTVYLANDYGFLINWNDKDPPEFYLYNKPENKITLTGDFSEFLAGLRKFPDGAKVDWIGKCAAPFHWCMPAPKREQVKEVIASRNFQLTGINENNYRVCICETREVRLLKTACRDQGSSSQ